MDYREADGRCAIDFNNFSPVVKGRLPLAGHYVRLLARRILTKCTMTHNSCGGQVYIQNVGGK